MTSQQKHPDLFGSDASLPAGFRYGANFLDASEEQALLNQIVALPFKEFQFHGFLGKRRVVSFGWRYDFNGGGLSKTEDMPAFLMAVRQKAASFAGVPPSNLQQVLVTEYRPGAAIGWHKDRSVFGDVVGISLLAPCAFRFRRKKEAGWDRVNTNGRAALHLSFARAIAQRMGAQHSGGRRPSLLPHLPQRPGTGRVDQ